MLNKIFLFSLFILLFISCSQPKPRKPVNRASSFDQSATIAFNKKLYENESKAIENYIKKDLLHTYINSQRGFWYAYLEQKPNETVVPIKGNTVVLNYDIQDFNGKIIYSESEIGNLNYKVDQEEIIHGLREGIKWMHPGEKIIFLLPSHKAYAYHGDENKIEPNTPIIVTLKLVEIKSI